MSGGRFVMRLAVFAKRLTGVRPYLTTETEKRFVTLKMFPGSGKRHFCAIKPPNS
jgi:hypothetical protein